MSTAAFVLTEDVDAESFDGTVTVSSGELYRVGAALHDSAHSNEFGKVIVTSDPSVIAALDHYPALMRVEPPESAAGEIVPAVKVRPEYAGTSGAANAGEVEGSLMPANADAVEVEEQAFGDPVQPDEPYGFPSLPTGSDNEDEGE